MISTVLDQKPEVVFSSDGIFDDGYFSLKLKEFTLKVWNLNKYYGWATSFKIIEENKPDFKIAEVAISKRMKLKLYDYVTNYDHEKVMKEKEKENRIKTVRNSLDWVK